MPRLTAEQTWYERLRRGLDRERDSPAVVEWAHDLLALRAHNRSFLRVGDDGRRYKWLPNPAADDDEATERATLKLMDKFGTALGIGPVPRSDVDDAAP